MPRPLLDPSFADSPYAGDAWTLTATGEALALAQTPPVFTLGNGFIGVRGPGEAHGVPRVYLNGVYEITPINYHEAAHGYARASDTRFAVGDATRVEILVDGVAAATQAIELDLARGVLREIRAAGAVRAVIQTLVSMEHRGVVATRVRLTGQAAKVELTGAVTGPPTTSGDAGAVYDPRIGPAPTAGMWSGGREIETPDVIGRVDRLARSGFEVAAVASRLDLTVTLAEGEEFVTDLFAAYAAGRDTDQLGEARRALARAAEAGFHALAAEQAAWFARFWADADIALADPQAEQATRHGLFQLIQAVGRDGATSLAAKGQSGEGYEGHVFWDAEIYALPVFVYTAPAIARAMLVWRIAHLNVARANARLMGHATGALYPWRTIGGAECSAFFPAGAAQYHINADIAHAQRLYVATTGDTTILAQGGAAMLAETARVWLQIGFHDPARGGTFVINRVTGPDEYSAIVDNNLYTNRMAAEHLRFAAEAGEVTPDEASAMRRAADSMFMPYDAEHDVPAQDDGFFALQPWPFEHAAASEPPLLLHYHPLVLYRHRVAKQADAVLAAALLPEAFDTATKRRMLDVYEGVTAHDSTLSASAFAILAARVGETARAAHYWRISAMTDLADLFSNSGHGLHMAALAGGWNALALGFAGLYTLGGELRFAPVAAPEVGDYALSVLFRGRRVRLAVNARGCRYTLSEGETLTLFHHGEAVTLTPGTPVERAHA